MNSNARGIAVSAIVTAAAIYLVRSPVTARAQNVPASAVDAREF